MAVTATLTNHFKYAVVMKYINLDTDTIKVLLMRSGFVFNKDIHATTLNIKATITGSSNITFAASGKTITHAVGGYTAAGFVDGNQIVVSGTSSNNGTYTITGTPSDTVITVVEALVNESNTSATITANDELATGSGYTQDTKTLSNTTVTENDTDDRMDFTCDSITWTASGGTIGPTPGMMLYSDTSSDNTIIGYLDFGGEQSASDGANFTISNVRIRLS